MKLSKMIKTAIEKKSKFLQDTTKTKNIQIIDERIKISAERDVFVAVLSALNGDSILLNIYS